MARWHTAHSGQSVHVVRVAHSGHGVRETVWHTRTRTKLRTPLSMLHFFRRHLQLTAAQRVRPEMGAFYSETAKMLTVAAQLLTEYQR